MEQYVSLDVSMEETNLRALDQTGGFIFEGSTPSRPQAIAKRLRHQAPNANRIVFKTGSLSNWLWHEIKALGLQVVCRDARHTHAAISVRMNKSDRNDALGLAELARIGWYREAKVTTMESRQIRAMPAARAKLVDLRRDIENQARGCLKASALFWAKRIRKPSRVKSSPFCADDYSNARVLNEGPSPKDACYHQKIAA